MQKLQSELAQDIAEKQVALGMDQSAFKLRNTSRGLNFENGIENFDNTLVFSIYIIMSCFVLTAIFCYLTKLFKYKLLCLHYTECCKILLESLAYVVICTMSFKNFPIFHAHIFPK